MGTIEWNETFYQSVDDSTKGHVVGLFFNGVEESVWRQARSLVQLYCRNIILPRQAARHTSVNRARPIRSFLEYPAR